MHLKIVRLLLLNKKVYRSSLKRYRLSTTYSCMNSFFCTRNDDLTTNFFSKNTLMRQDLLFDHKLLFKELCIPINLTNTHWLLIDLDLKNNTFFPINPYHPQNPSTDEIQTTGEIALKILQQYGLQEYERRIPDNYHCHRIP